MNTNLLTLIPSLEPNEFAFLQVHLNNLPEDKLRLFVSLYTSKRKSPETILICCCIGFVGAAGIHRFVVGHIAMGVLYILTAGLCFIGTIVDLINHKSIAFEYNQQMAFESLAMIKGY